MARLSYWTLVALIATCISCWVQAAPVRRLPSVHVPRYLTTFASWPEDRSYQRRFTSPIPVAATTHARFTARPGDYAYSDEQYQRILDALYNETQHESHSQPRFEAQDFVDDDTPLEEILARISTQNTQYTTPLDEVSTRAPSSIITGETTTIRQEEYTGNECAICLENIEEDESHKLLCGHKFHWQCVKKWVDQSSSSGYFGHFRSKCPMCRQSFMFKKY